MQKEILKWEFVILHIHLQQERSANSMQPARSTSPHGFPSLSYPSTYILHLGLPVILAEFLLFGVSLHHDISIDPAYAMHYYPGMLEHIMMSLTLLIAGAFLFDYIAKRET